MVTRTFARVGGGARIGSSFVKIPGMYSVHWVRILGVSVQNASQRTVPLVIHSVHGGALVPGNQLIDV